MKPLIISLSVNGRENYLEKVKGLEKSLIPFANDFDVRIYKEYPDYCTPHSFCPYLFKYDLMEEAISDGYKKIFWMDSSMRVLKNPFGLLSEAEKGIVAFDNIGHPAWKYTSDEAALNLSKYYDDIMEVKQTWGGCTGWDFTKPMVYKIFRVITRQGYEGSFNYGNSDREGFVASRNDQTVLSYVFHHYKIPLLPYGIIAAKPHVTDKTYIQYGD